MPDANSSGSNAGEIDVCAGRERVGSKRAGSKIEGEVAAPWAYCPMNPRNIWRDVTRSIGLVRFCSPIVD